MTDPGDVVEGIERARDAFEYVGHGSPDYETAVSRADAWRTQLTKACRYLASTRTLRAAEVHDFATDQIREGGVCVCE